MDHHIRNLRDLRQYTEGDYDFSINLNYIDKTDEAKFTGLVVKEEKEALDKKEKLKKALKQ